MKKLLLIILLTSLTSTIAQQFSNLKGIEDQQGSTILLYSFGNDMYGSYSPVYKYNPLTNQEIKIIDAYSQQIDTFNVNTKSVQDYEFFPDDLNNFINVGLTINIDVLGYAARNDTTTFTDWAFFFVDISKQHPNQVYISDFFKVYRSFDAGYTYPADSIIDFQFLSIADFDDNTLFGVDENRNLIKSNNSGITSTIVDTAKVNTSLPFLKFYFDTNDQTIYRLNSSYDKITLNVSTNNGDAFTWSKVYESEKPFYISIDTTETGVIFLTNGNKILKSTDFGSHFTVYKTLPNNLNGIYKKPGSEILYVTTKYNIYKINNGTIIPIKSVPIPSYVFEYYPLTVGNRWVFNFVTVDYWPFPIYRTDLFSRTVVDYVTKENDKQYFQIDQKFMSSGDVTTYYERIDSSTGKILRYEISSPDSEQVIDDLLGEVGDSLMVNRFEPHYSNIPTIFEDMEQYSEFGITSSKRIYKYPGLLFADYSLVHKIGLEHILLGYDFGSDIYDLKGFVINGIVYGDTTVTSIDDFTNALPTEYKLNQNFPNPFNPSTNISWQSPISSHQSLKVYDVLGNEVATLVDEFRNSGSYEIDFDASQLASGVYFYQLKAGDYLETKKMLLMK